MGIAGKFLRRQRRALGGGKLLDEGIQPGLVDQVDGSGGLALVGLDQGVLVVHALAA